MPYKEQANEDMVSNMDNLHQYIPVVEQEEGRGTYQSYLVGISLLLPEV